MEYKQAVSFLIAHFPQYQKVGMGGYKPYPARMLSLVEWLGNPQMNYPCIHIAGTNGKGSVAHMLAAILQVSGLRTGLYTSPHLKDFRERMKVNGRMIPEEEVASFVTHYVENKMQETGEERPSFFDMTTAMAFQYFAQEKVDVAVIETGLGGRLDSTNILTSQSVILSVITNIGLDHCDLLGHTLSEIAEEKAGIIKPGVPVVLGEYHPESFPVIKEQAGRLGSMLTCAYENPGVGYSIEGDSLYQRKNLQTAYSAIEVLKKTQPKLMECVTEASVTEGLEHFESLTGLHGRWERVAESPAVILDTGHNAHGLAYLKEQLSKETYDHLYVVFGVVREKELDRIANLLPRDARYYFTQPGIERALPAEDLYDWAGKQGLSGEMIPSVQDAFKKACATASPQDMILVGGSTFTVADVVEIFFARKENKSIFAVPLGA